MRIHPNRLWKMAALAAVLSMPFAACPPMAEAETIVDDFSQAVETKMNSDSELMREARQYAQAAVEAHKADPSVDYNHFRDAHQSEYPELSNEEGHGMDALGYITSALSTGNNDAEDAAMIGILSKVSYEMQADPRYENNQVLTQMSGNLGGTTTASIARGRITAGSSHIFGDQNVYGALAVRNGIDANGKKIAHVKDGEISETSKDAVNGSQLNAVGIRAREVSNEFNTMGGALDGAGNRIGRLNNKINRVGAGAAALASLHPLPYKGGQKWSAAAGYGHYHDSNAPAAGAYYAPNENIVLSLGSVLGNGENMMNAGVSLRLGPSETDADEASAEDVENLKSLVQDQGQRIEALQKKNILLLEEIKAKKAGHKN